VAAVISVWGFTTAKISNLAIRYFIRVSGKYSATSPHSGCVSSSSIICFCRKHFMQCCNILEIVPITQPGLSSSLSLPRSGFSATSSSCFTSSLVPGHACSLRLSQIAINISAKVLSGSLVVDYTCSTFLISSCSCTIGVSAS